MVNLIVILAGLIADAVKAHGDPAKEEEVLMRAQEEIKAELDRRKFGG